MLIVARPALTKDKLICSLFSLNRYATSSYRIYRFSQHQIPGDLGVLQFIINQVLSSSPPASAHLVFMLNFWSIDTQQSNFANYLQLDCITIVNCFNCIKAITRLYIDSFCIRIKSIRKMLTAFCILH